jgi:hypothetical protein
MRHDMDVPKKDVTYQTSPLPEGLAIMERFRAFLEEEKGTSIDPPPWIDESALIPSNDRRKLAFEHT